MPLQVIVSLLASLVVLTSVVPQGVSPVRPTPSTVTTLSRATDSPTVKSPVSKPESLTRAESLYIAVLEKTNQQLSLATNPWSLMVAGLGVLFTVGAILAGWLLYRQSADFKQQRNLTLDQADKAVRASADTLREEVTALLAEFRAQRDQLHADLTTRIEEATARADAATGEAKGEIEKELQTLRTLQSRVEQQSKTVEASGALTGSGGSSLGASATQGSYTSSLPMGKIHRRIPIIGAASLFEATTPPRITIAPRRHKCAFCGKEFGVPDTLSLAARLPQTVECPHCGKLQQVSM